MSKRMAIAGIMAAASVAASLLAPTAAFADKDTFKLDVESANGSGCPTPDTAAATVADDGKAFTVTYNAFEARGGSSKNCQLGVKVHVPMGITFAIYKVDNRGDAYLKKNATGKHTMTSYFAGETNTLVSRHNIKAPYDDVWQSSFSAARLDWAPCNKDRTLNINNILRVTGADTNYMNMFSTDMGVSTIFHIQTKVCS